jgi:hypothetical protein
VHPRALLDRLNALKQRDVSGKSAFAPETAPDLKLRDRRLNR